jgi:hypothetical protein
VRAVWGGRLLADPGVRAPQHDRELTQISLGMDQLGRERNGEEEREDA